MTFKVVFLLVGIVFVSQQALSNNNTSKKDKLTIVEKNTEQGLIYIIESYADKYLSDNDYRLYEIASLRAKKKLLSLLQKNNNNLKDKAIILNGFTKEKCWYSSETLYKCKFSIPLSGISFKEKQESVKQYIKKLDLLEGVTVVDFDDKRYVVSLASGSTNNITLIEKLNLIKSTKLLAESDLIKFSNGEQITYDMSYIEKTTVIKSISEVKSNTIKSVKEVIKSNSYGITKALKYFIDYSENNLNHYAYIEIPKE